MGDFVDTNIEFRLLTAGDPDKSERSRRLFARAQAGDVDSFTSEAVVLEVIQVLTSPRLSRMERSAVAVTVSSLLASPWFGLDHQATNPRAFALYGGTTLDFTGCLPIEHSRRLGKEPSTALIVDLIGFLGCAASSRSHGLRRRRPHYSRRYPFVAPAVSPEM